MKSFKLIITAVAALLAVETMSAQTLNDVKAKYNEAAVLMQSKDFKKAIDAFEATIDMGFDVGPDASDVVTAAQKQLPACYFYYGLALCKENKFSEAIPVLNNAVVFGEDYGDMASVRRAKQLTSQAYMAMGADAFNNKDYAKAIEVFSQGYAANPTDTQLALYLAESYAESGDYDNAYKVYNEVIALENRHSRYKQAADDAREKMNYYLALQSDDVAKSGDIEGAYKLMDQILVNDPYNSFAHMQKILLAVQAKQWDNIIAWGEDAAIAQTEGDKESDVYFYIAAAYDTLDNNAKAIEYYKKVDRGSNKQKAKARIEDLSKLK